MDYLIFNGANPFRDKIAAPFEKRLAMTDAYSTVRDLYRTNIHAY